MGGERVVTTAKSLIPVIRLWEDDVNSGGAGYLLLQSGKKTSALKSAAKIEAPPEGVKPKPVEEIGASLWATIRATERDATKNVCRLGFFPEGANHPVEYVDVWFDREDEEKGKAEEFEGTLNVVAQLAAVNVKSSKDMSDFAKSLMDNLEAKDKEISELTKQLWELKAYTFVQQNSQQQNPLLEKMVEQAMPYLGQKFLEYGREAKPETKTAPVDNADQKVRKPEDGPLPTPTNPTEMIDQIVLYFGEFMEMHPEGLEARHVKSVVTAITSKNGRLKFDASAAFMSAIMG